jgi:RNA polymerase sigma factor (sigma-70 family)
MTTPHRPSSAPAPELAALVAKLFPKLRRFFASKTQSAQDAQDLAQSTIVVVLSRDAATLDDPRKYVWGVAYNKLKQHYERRSGRSFDTEQVSLQQISTTLGTRLDRRTRVGDAMRQLPLTQQTAIELRFGEGLKLEEIVVVTNRSLATVKRDIATGLATMRGILRTMDGDEDLGLQAGADYRHS